MRDRVLSGQLFTQAGEACKAKMVCEFQRASRSGSMTNFASRPLEQRSNFVGLQRQQLQLLASQTEFEPHVTGVDLECGAGRIWRALQKLEAKDVQSEIFAVQFLPSCRPSQKRLDVSPSRHLGCMNMPP